MHEAIDERDDAGGVGEDAYSAQSEQRFHAIVNSAKESAAVAADSAWSDYDERGRRCMRTVFSEVATALAAGDFHDRGLSLLGGRPGGSTSRIDSPLVFNSMR